LREDKSSAAELVSGIR